MHTWFISRVLGKIHKWMIFLPVGGLASLTPYLLQDLSLFCFTRRLKRKPIVSCRIYRCFATLRRLKRNPTILQEFVLLTCNYRSTKRQFSLLPSTLRGRQVSYNRSVILCENLCNILFVYNKLSYIFINSVSYYHWYSPIIFVC